GAKLVQEDDEIMLITSGGTLVRTRVDEVSVMGRNTQGVRLIRLGEDEQLTGIECIANIQTDESIDINTGDEVESGTDVDSPESE
ncbi:MAG: hypothetical protein OEW97_07300, partial [Gammaproteobacteria bacterium]|nr:hypothetical protein [Gammaproteobacteria bacterium]